MLAKWTARQTVLSVDPSSTIIKFNISRLPTTTFLNVKIAQKIITVNDCNNDFTYALENITSKITSKEYLDLAE